MIGSRKRNGMFTEVDNRTFGVAMATPGTFSRSTHALTNERYALGGLGDVLGDHEQEDGVGEQDGDAQGDLLARVGG